jgi:hypothetical protein
MFSSNKKEKYYNKQYLSFNPVGTGFFISGKVAGGEADHSPSTSSRTIMVELHLHSTSRLHGEALNKAQGFFYYFLLLTAIS